MSVGSGGVWVSVSECGCVGGGVVADYVCEFWFAWVCFRCE